MLCLPTDTDITEIPQAEAPPRKDKPDYLGSNIIKIGISLFSFLP